MVIQEYISCDICKQRILSHLDARILWYAERIDEMVINADYQIIHSESCMTENLDKFHSVPYVAFRTIGKNSYPLSLFMGNQQRPISGSELMRFLYRINKGKFSDEI